MKKRLLITLSLTIILSIFLAGPVSAEGMALKAIPPAEAAHNGNVPGVSRRPIHPCIIGRRNGFTQLGNPHGMYGCLNRSAVRYGWKYRW